MIEKPINLRCEFLLNPINIDVKNPRFSWNLKHEQRNQCQSAFRIIVSSSYSSILSETGDLWDSRKVISSNNSNIKYNGKELTSNSVYYWRVKWWDKNDIESEFSAIAKFETALLSEDDWKSNWITMKGFSDKKFRRKYQYKTGQIGLSGNIKGYPALYFRKEFQINKKIEKAKVYVCGLGCHELRINGKKVGTNILDPAMTDYKKIALYSTYDITDYLKNNNAVGIILGNGRYIENFGYDFPKFILQIHAMFKDKSELIISSDNSWKSSFGPIIKNGLYLGEIYDANLEMPDWDLPNYDDSEWMDVEIIKGPPLSSQLLEPIKIEQVIKPKSLKSPKQGVYVVDFGQNFSGFAKIRVNGPRGTEVKLRFAEILNEDGTLNIATNRGAISTDIYVLKGGSNETFMPHFTYHGFRYVEITGCPGVPKIEDIEGLFFHTDVEKIGFFNCSNKIINKIHKNILWSQLSNLMSIPTDCPQRDERQGWMGDAQLTVEEAIFNFNMVRFYLKYLRDILLSQKEDGSLSDVVPPYWKFYPADPAWGTAFLTIAWTLYWYYEEKEILENAFEGMLNYIKFLDTLADENHVIKYCKYGDWCPPGSIVSRKTPGEQVSTWYYYHDTLLLAKIAKILNKEDISKDLFLKSEMIKESYNKEFISNLGYITPKLTIVDSTISQTSQILPLYLSMVPQDKVQQVLSILLKSIIDDQDYHLDTGIIGTRYLFDVLAKYDLNDVAYKIITQKSYPGWYYMIREGATTLWERWEKLEKGGMNSHNHAMLGSVDTWFYKHLVGIQPIEPGWKKIKIKPFFPDDMKFATASIESLYGIISVSWEKYEKNLKIIISIPVNSEGELWIKMDNKKLTVFESEEIIWKENGVNGDVDGINTIFKNKNYLIIHFGSGNYRFLIQNE